MRNKRYTIFISDSSRLKLNETNENRGAYTRIPLSNYYHGEYVDNRPDWLVRAHAWSIDDRHNRTMVHLTPEQVVAVLKLAASMDIAPRPGIKPKSMFGAETHLLSTFLEAVLHDYLISTKVENDNS